MAAKFIPLTNTQVKQAKPDPLRVVKLSDGGGLQLLIKPSGSKIWHLRYMKPVTNKQTTLSLGSYPSVSLAKAREKRVEVKSLVADGIDPINFRNELAENKRIEHSNSFRAVFDEWFEIKEAKIQPKQSKLIIRAFENHLFKSLGKVPISQLKPPQVIKVIRKVEEQGKFDLTKRLCARVNEVMKFAVFTGRISYNPLTDITEAFIKVKSIPNPAVPPEKLPWLLDVIRDGDMKVITRCLIKWQLNTMVRPKEAAMAEWSEIDFEKKLWIIPAVRMGKTKRSHSVPLTSQALELLDKLKPLTGSDTYIFASFRKVSGHVHQETVNKALRRMGLGGIQSAHGFRSVASTTLNEKGFNVDLIETSLAHRDKNQIRQVYNRADYIDRRREMMQWWSDHIDQCSKGVYNLLGTVPALKLVNG